MTTFKCTVNGTPATQGSMKGFVVPAKGGRKARAVVAHGRDSKIVAWRKSLHDSLYLELCRMDAWQGLHNPATPRFSEAVCVCLEVILPRLASHPKTAKGRPAGWPVGKSDLDKHCRAVGDSLTSAGVLADDGLICEWHASKRFANLGEAPGVVVEVTEL